MEDLRKKIENNIFDIIPYNEWFTNLETQGVLFLNASLTVEAYCVGSHTNIWETFMNELIQYINKQNVVWMLFGKDAEKRVKPLLQKDNYILTSHPRLDKFIYENPFGKVKDINWKGVNYTPQLSFRRK